MWPLNSLQQTFLTEVIEKIIIRRLFSIPRDPNFILHRLFSTARGCKHIYQRLFSVPRCHNGLISCLLSTERKCASHHFSSWPHVWKKDLSITSFLQPRVSPSLDSTPLFGSSNAPPSTQSPLPHHNPPKMTTVMFAETLGNLQHSTQRIPECRSHTLINYKYATSVLELFLICPVISAGYY
jgi:hypothetical protein